LKALQAAIAGLMIVATVACLAVIIHAGNELNREVGPNAMTVAPDGRLFVVSHGKVHVFTAEERREKVLDLVAMGAPRVPSDIAVRSDGQLYLADQVGATLVACEIERSRCGGQHLGLRSWTPEHLMPNNTFKFTLDETRRRIYFSDNGGNRMLITDADGRALGRSAGDRSIVWFPNQVASFAPGEMTVADTNHKRVVTFDVSEDQVGRVQREFSTAAPGIARDKREWPFAMARLPGGGTWVAVAGDQMKDADVILYDPEGKPLVRADLGPRSDPWAMAYWNGSVVVGDARNYRLHAFAPNGSKVREFRDAGFEQELREREVHALAWQQYRQFAIVGIIAFPLVGIGLLRGMGVPLLSPSRQPISRPANVEQPPDPRALTWIRTDPKYIEFVLKQARQVRIMFVPLMLLMPLSFFLVFGAPFEVRILWALGGIMAGMAVLMGIALFLTGRGVRKNLDAIRLGVSREGFHYVAPPGSFPVKVVQGGPVPWRDVYFDGRRLLAGKQIILAKLPQGQEVFERAELEREILARIPKANFVNTVSLGLKQFTQMSVGQKIGTVLMIAVALALLFAPLLRK
jgi:sugar lactone lactonase YvrE